MVKNKGIAIARALVLVLDKATSSLGSASENYIQKAIERLRKQNKTIVIVAHKLSTVI